MASPLPARNVSTTRPYDEAPFQPPSAHRKVSVIYGASAVRAAAKPPANDNPRPRDAAIKAAANDNQNNATQYKTGINLPQRDFGPSTVSDEFNETYNQAGLQPSVGGVIPYRNTQIDRAPATQLYTATPANDPSKEPQKGRQKMEGLKAIVSPASPTPVRTRSKSPKKALLKGVPGGDGLAGDLINRALVTQTSLMITSAAGFFWFSFHLPLALISLVALGTASAVEAAKKFVFKSHAEEFLFGTNYIERATSWVAGKVYSITNSIVDFFLGFNLDTFSPTTLFMITDAVVMIVGWLTLLIIGFVYLIQGIPCVFGEKGSGLKIAALLMALIGYALPFLNLFPWFIVWVAAVWLYPE